MVQNAYTGKLIGDSLGQTIEMDLEVGEVECDKYMRVRVRLETSESNL